MNRSKLSAPPLKIAVESKLYSGQQTLDKLLKLDSEFFQLPHKRIKAVTLRILISQEI